MLARGGSEFRDLGTHWVDAKYIDKHVTVARLAAGSWTEAGLYQRGNLVHQRVIVQVRTIPFKQGELGIVATAGLAVAKGPGNLEDGAASRREQPLHRVLG